MDFDSRWNDDPRDRDNYGRELSQGSRGGLSNPREREPLDARDVFTRDLELPRGPETLTAADTCAAVRVCVGRRLVPARPPAEERMGGGEGRERPGLPRIWVGTG